MSEKTGEIGEFLLISAGAFAYPIFNSLQVVLSSVPQAPVSNTALAFMLGYECIVFAVLWWILRTRGWTAPQFGLRMHRSDVAIALPLLALCYVAFLFTYAIASDLGAKFRPVEEWFPIEGKLDPWLVVAISVINPIFEEVFVCGYTITVLSRIKGPWVAINVSIAVRLAYHLYQGTSGVAGILPMGFICALWYARTGRLWPVIIAHGLMDFIAFYEYI